MSVKVKQDKNGLWHCRKYLGRMPSGKLIQAYKSFPAAATEQEAQQLADTWERHLTADGKVASVRLIDLLREYAETKRLNGASPNSIRNYRLFTENYVARFIRNRNAGDLTVVDFNRFEHELLRMGGKNGAPLSRNTVNNVHHFLRGAYNHFVSAGICAANPMVSVAVPMPESHDAEALAECDFAELMAELERLIRAGGESKRAYRRAVYAFAAWLALVTGMRCGEVCAVRPRDGSAASRFVRVCGNVVEDGSRVYRRDVTKGLKHRNVSITEHDVEVVTAFAKLRERFCGRVSSNIALVTIEGNFMRPTTVSRGFTAICKRIGLPETVTFHVLRHTHATWCLANGVDIKTLSERLGHKDPATTMRIYSHVMPGRDAAAADTFERAARRARGGD